MEAAFPVTDKLIAEIDLGTFVEQALERSRERLGALLAQ
jgi:hypothetical protein